MGGAKEEIPAEARFARSWAQKPVGRGAKRLQTGGHRGEELWTHDQLVRAMMMKESEDTLESSEWSCGPGRLRMGVIARSRGSIYCQRKGFLLAV